MGVNSGTFIMNGGTISGNESTLYDGGGVRVNTGSFTMNGGTISGNIGGNTGITSCGGVALVGSTGTFVMKKGSIVDNSGFSGQDARSFIKNTGSAAKATWPVGTTAYTAAYGSARSGSVTVASNGTAAVYIPTTALNIWAE
jgi:hypothetical protein